jgi:hypothetical protein
MKLLPKIRKISRKGKTISEKRYMYWKHWERRKKNYVGKLTPFPKK